MKRIAVLLVLLLAANLMGAQQVKVESFTEDLSGGEAKGCPVKDRNGNCCALLKVQIQDNGVEFASDWLIKSEGKSEQEYWAWLCEGTREVTIKSNRIRDCEVRFEDYNTEVARLQGGHVYVLMLRVVNDGEGEPVNVEFSCNAKDAALFIDNIAVGTASSTVLVPSGEHSIRAEKEHYEKFSGTIIISPARFKKRISYEIVMDTLIDDPEGQYLMGEKYWMGKGVKQDEQNAIKWFALSADNGYEKAKTRLDKYYAYKKAVSAGGNDSILLRLAAEAGYREAQCEYADQLRDKIRVQREKRGVEREVIEAWVKEVVMWYEKAAEQGSVFAMERLGDHYCHYDIRLSNEKNAELLEKAIWWYQQVIDNGGEKPVGMKYAKEWLQKIKKRMKK